MQQVRHIESKMIEFLDAKLSGNGLAQHAIKNALPRLLMVEAAKVCVGIREATGHNDGPMVELIQRTIGEAEGESWCMALVQTMIAYVEIKLGITSPIYAGEGCTQVWEETSHTQRVKYNPLPGAIAIWKYPGTWKGHTGIVLAADESIFQAVEGNTTNGVIGSKIIREGGGVYYTERSRAGDGAMRLIGFLKPF
jgi:hypothetical protein